MPWRIGEDDNSGQVTLPTRKKSEVLWTGLTGRTFAADTDINLINFLKALPTPTSGSLLPFFNTTSNKLNAYNTNNTLTFKLSVSGSWSGGSTSRSMQVDFSGTNGNRLVESRDVAVTTDNLTFATFFSIDVGGNIVTNGTAITLRSNGGTFTVTSILLIAEQMGTVESISAV